MTRQEIEKAIENGESVWVVFKENFDTRPNLLYEVNKQNIVAIGDIGVFYFNKLLNRKFRASFSECYKTHLEALHYANHANITRIETMPFLTWEEFLKKQEIRFVDNIGEVWRLYYCYSDEFAYIYLQSWFGYHGKKTRNPQNLGELIEENFYKAYDECVKMFLGRED